MPGRVEEVSCDAQGTGAPEWAASRRVSRWPDVVKLGLSHRGDRLGRRGLQREAYPLSTRTVSSNSRRHAQLYRFRCDPGWYAKYRTHYRDRSEWENFNTGSCYVSAPASSRKWAMAVLKEMLRQPKLTNITSVRGVRP